MFNYQENLQGILKGKKSLKRQSRQQNQTHRWQGYWNFQTRNLSMINTLTDLMNKKRRENHSRSFLSHSFFLSLSCPTFLVLNNLVLRQPGEAEQSQHLCGQWDRVGCKRTEVAHCKVPPSPSSEGISTHLSVWCMEAGRGPWKGAPCWVSEPEHSEEWGMTSQSSNKRRRHPYGWKAQQRILERIEEGIHVGQGGKTEMRNWLYIGGLIKN